MSIVGICMIIYLFLVVEHGKKNYLTASDLQTTRH